MFLEHTFSKSLILLKLFLFRIYSQYRGLPHIFDLFLHDLNWLLWYSEKSSPMRSIPTPLVLVLWPLEGATTELVLPGGNYWARIYFAYREYISWWVIFLVYLCKVQVVHATTEQHQLTIQKSDCKALWPPDSSNNLSVDGLLHQKYTTIFNWFKG